MQYENNQQTKPNRNQLLDQRHADSSNKPVFQSIPYIQNQGTTKVLYTSLSASRVYIPLRLAHATELQIYDKPITDTDTTTVRASVRVRIRVRARAEGTATRATTTRATDRASDRASDRVTDSATD